MKTTRCDLAIFDSLLGRTYAEVGTEARSMHKCQGQAQLLALPGPALQSYQLGESTLPGAMDRDEKSLFDGIDTSISGLAKFAGARAPKELVDGLAAVAANVQAAQKKFDSEGDDATLPPLLAGLHAVRALVGQLRAMSIDDGRATRSTSVFARRSGSSSRPRSPPTACASKRWPTTAWSCRGSR